MVKVETLHSRVSRKWATYSDDDSLERIKMCKENATSIIADVKRRVQIGDIFNIATAYGEILALEMLEENPKCKKKLIGISLDILSTLDLATVENALE